MIMKKTYWMISIKLGGRMRDRPRKNPFNFGLDVDVGDHSKDVPLGVSRIFLLREKFSCLPFF